MKWQSLSVQEIYDKLLTSPQGLSESEAGSRLKQAGENKMAEQKPKPLYMRFFAQFNDFLVIILLSAAAVSFMVSLFSEERDFLDPIIIMFIVVLNAVLGLVQEAKASKALQALQKLSAPESMVLRNGQAARLPTSRIVPGDVLLLSAGDYVPADARLIDSSNLKAEESMLTGESLPANKRHDAKIARDAALGDMKNMVFSGTSIVYGNARAVVAATGMNTEMGRIAHLLMTQESPQTPLQKRLEKTGRILGSGALVICAVIFLLGLLRHFSPFDMFMTSVSLAVAAIPEGLPAIVTIMLAIGVQRMAKGRAIIRKLPAVETLGSATVICSDKTGTLTQNKMKVVETASSSGRLSAKDSARKKLLTFAALCSNATAALGDPTETALVQAAEKYGQSLEELQADYPRRAEIPFDSERKRMTVLAGEISITKGAVDVLLERASHYEEGGAVRPLTAKIKADFLAQNAILAEQALRVLAVAYRAWDAPLGVPGHPTDRRTPKAASIEPRDAASDRPRDTEGGVPYSERAESNLIMLGLIGMFDPPRPEAAESVAICKTAGIRTIMVTGDHALTAKAIAKKVGILEATGNRAADGRGRRPRRPVETSGGTTIGDDSVGGTAITGKELSGMTDEQLADRIADCRVFARVSPEHKVRLVKALQAKGEVVAMTGDGVNDAPALKAADIGCAMGKTGTDVAKAAADMVLTDDNFATIVTAVREGRGIYSNIRKAVHFLLSSNIGEIVTIFTAIFMGWGTPLLAIHLLWVNLVTDSLPAIALGLDPADDSLMTQKPYNSKKSMFADGLGRRIALEGVMIGTLSLIAFGLGVVFFDNPGQQIMGMTMCFMVLSISQLFHAFNMRSTGSIFAINPLGNKYLVGALFAGILLQVSVVSTPALAAIFRVAPLVPEQWGIIFGLSVLPIVIVEVEKRVIG